MYKTNKFSFVATAFLTSFSLGFSGFHWLQQVIVVSVLAMHVDGYAYQPTTPIRHQCF